MPFGMGDGNFDLGALGGWMGGLFGGQGTNPLSPATGNGTNIRPNMNPVPNAWEGDNFIIGKPQVNGGPGTMGGHSVPGTVPPGGAGSGTNPAPTGAGGMNPFLGQMGLGMMQAGQRPRMQAADLAPYQAPQMMAPQMPQNTQLSMMPPRAQNPFMQRKYG